MHYFLVTHYLLSGLRDFGNGFYCSHGTHNGNFHIDATKGNVGPRAVLSLLDIGAGLPFVALWFFKQV